jgi:hypothetical protein
MFSLKDYFLLFDQLLPLSIVHHPNWFSPFEFAISSTHFEPTGMKRLLSLGSSKITHIISILSIMRLLPNFMDTGAAGQASI